MKRFPMSGAASALIAIAAAFAIAGCGSSQDSAPADAISKTAEATQSTSTPDGNTVDASLNEWSIKTKQQTVKAGKVTFDATNDGAAPHELVVLKTDTPAGDLGSGSRVKETGSVGEVSDVQPGKSGKTTIDLKPGKYVLICNLPAHYSQGMYTALTVK